MNRKTWLAVGLSMLVGTGIATTLPASAVTHRDGTSSRAVQPARWGEQGSEQGEVESPRWGDQGSEQGEVESPRTDSGYQGGDQTDTGAPRV